MAAGDLATYQRRRLNPFRGLVIDVPVWSDAHNYHRDQLRLHAMSSHRHGIVTGLEVVAWNPPDNSVVIYPGVAVDHQGNTIVLAQPQRFYLKVEEPGAARITVCYSEILPDMAAKPTQGKPQPVYITEAFRIEEQRQRPAGPYIELARLDITGGSRAIKDPANPYSPSRNEIDMRYRTVSAAKPAGEITVGVLSHRGGRLAPGWDSHCQGILNLVQSMQQGSAYSARMVDAVDLSAEVLDCDLLCLTGYGEFQLSESERQLLTHYFQRGGVLFAEPCPGPDGQHQDQIKGFRSSFAGLCEKLGHPLHTLDRVHPVFHSCHVFSSSPAGSNGSAMVLGNESVIFSDADYGCAWQGGRNGQPLSRQVIRDAIEFGANIAAYACRNARLKAIRILQG